MALILDVDPVMEDEPAFLDDHRRHQRAGLTDGIIPGGGQIRQLLALAIGDIQVIDQVKVE